MSLLGESERKKSGGVNSPTTTWTGSRATATSGWGTLQEKYGYSKEKAKDEVERRRGKLS